MQRKTRRARPPERNWRPNIHQALIAVSLAGLLLSLSTLLSRWPYSLAAKLNLDAEIGIESFLKIVQVPALIFFFFLSLYAIKRSIEQYRRSFDLPVKLSGHH